MFPPLPEMSNDTQDPGCQEETQAGQVEVAERESAGGGSLPISTSLVRGSHSVKWVRVLGYSLGVRRLQPTRVRKVLCCA